MDGRKDKGDINVARLRARIVWSLAKARFLRGATTATFKRSDVAKMLEIDLDREAEDPFGGIDAVVMLLPEDGRPAWDGDDLTISDPDKYRNAPDEDEVIQVLEYWRVKTGRSERTDFSATRKGVIRARLRDGYSVEQLFRAVDALMRSSFHVDGGYTDATHAFRADRLERWLTAASDSTADEIDRVADATIQRRRRRNAG